eukprot:SM000353S13169  [mRNA]  locus=s353:71036:73341:- [translate_table: standard]
MQDPGAVPALRRVLQDPAFHPMVRHEKPPTVPSSALEPGLPSEPTAGAQVLALRLRQHWLEPLAAEALGAIGDAACIGLLEEGAVDPSPEVSETCQLALRRIQSAASESRSEEEDGGADLESRSPYLSVDPAPAAKAGSTTAELRKLLLDERADMFDRYAALFGLRNKGGPAEVGAIVEALACQSALLRHEIAYVLGQLQDRSSVAALEVVLQDLSEHPMVRHEAAEALGSIADAKSVRLLQKYQQDLEPIVAQSCDVALDMLSTEADESGNEPKYADLIYGVAPQPAPVTSSA